MTELKIDITTNTSTLAFAVNSMGEHFESLKSKMKGNYESPDLTHDISMLNYIYNDMVKEQSHILEERLKRMQSEIEDKKQEVKCLQEHVSSLKSISDSQQETLAELNSFARSNEGQMVSAESILDTINNT